MGSQRIVSKIGDLESFGADPRRVVYAGHGVDGIDEVDFAGKYQTATGNIKERYQSFDLEYKGEENNDYVNGQGLCCTDKKAEIEQYETSESKDGETPERLIYFYHSDHLGSSSLITNFDGEVTQHIEYIPYGEVFIEERNNVWNTPYLFNAKELDEETGLYYYGARYLNPMDAMWLSVDPLFEKYVGMSPYNYCAGNPVNFIDPDGMRLTLTGTEEDVNSTVEEHNTNMGGFYKASVDENGEVSLNPLPNTGSMSEGQINYYKALSTVVNDPAMTTINVVNRSSDVLIGNVNTATIDIGDIKALNGRIASSAGALIHETLEQYNVQAKVVGNNTAHVRATRTENSVTGYQADPFTRIQGNENMLVQSEIVYLRGNMDLSKSGYLEYINFDSNNNVINVTKWMPLSIIAKMKST